MTSALVRNLRLAYPDATVTMLCAPGLRRFIVSQNIADEAIGFDRRGKGKSLFQRLRAYLSLVSDLRQRRYDLTIDLSDSKTSRILHRLLDAPLRVGFDPPERPLRFWEVQPANVYAATCGHGGIHYLYRYLSPLKALNIDLADSTPRLVPTCAAQSESAQILAQRSLVKNAYIVVHAGARFEGRCWQPERFAAAIDEVYAATSLRSLLIGGRDETTAEQTILALAVSPVASVVGKVSLETLTALLGDAVIFLGNESGPMHLAASVGTPVVGLYGLTPPDIWGPLGVPHRIVAPRLPCQCAAPNLCKPNNPGGVYCVHRVRVEEVTTATLDLIEFETLKSIPNR
ncbi:glycosyltransferase family 9 protein [Mesorhizobium sp. M0400]|uniref:glycosyltransferase family 9 protein n=2 Tax=Mesorhizobium TaxID=68287 RepID=UPI003339196A